MKEAAAGKLQLVLDAKAKVDQWWKCHIEFSHRKQPQQFKIQSFWSRRVVTLAREMYKFSAQK